VDSAVTVSAPAKVNLALRVGRTRADSYHDVSTVMLTVGLADTVTIAPAAAGVSLVCDPDPGFPADDDLTVRAVRALAAVTGREPAVAIGLEKRIPIAAGLGGGSADCAAALVACCSLWCIDVADPVIAGVAASLGADVPFMLHGGCALYAGRGDERVAALETPLLDLVLVNAGVAVPTAEVYRVFDTQLSPGSASVDAMVRALASGDRRALATALANDLTDAAVAVAPAIADVVAFVRHQPGVLGGLLAGSGGTVFGITESATAAESAASAASSRGWWAVATSSAAARSA